VYEFEGNPNTHISGVVHPKLRISWSRRRAWHGETVSIQVRTELVNDGTQVKLEIHSDDGKLALDTFDKETITGNKLDKDYKIDWKSKKLKKDPHTFVVKATIKTPSLTAQSAQIGVDLAPPQFSA
jgi:hypothetical protein